MMPDKPKEGEDGDHEPDSLSPNDDGDDGLAAVDCDENLVATDDILASKVNEEQVIEADDIENVSNVNAIRRIRHNVKEKERKEKIKIDMQEIRSLLPSSVISDKKQTHHDVLQLAIQFMRSLINQNQQLVASGANNYNNEEVDHLRKENEDLKLESSRYNAILGAAGIPSEADLSHLVFSWRYRTLDQMGNPYLYPTNAHQQMTASSSSVENEQHQQMSTDVTQQYNGQIQYATADGSTASQQYTMFTDLLNSSDPCMVLPPGGSGGNQPNSFAPPGTSFVGHNGQFMFLSPSSMPIDQTSNHQITENQCVNHTMSFADETTIDRRQLEANGVEVKTLETEPLLCSNETSASGGEATEIQVEATANVECAMALSQDVISNDLSRSSDVAMTTVYTDLSNARAPTTSNGCSESFNNGNGGGGVAQNPFEQQNAPTTVASMCSDVAPSNQGGRGGDGQMHGSFILHNGQLLLVNQNQNMAQSMANLNPMIGQDFSGFCSTANQQIGGASNLPIQCQSNSNPSMFINKSNQYGQQSMFFPSHSQSMTSAVLQPPLASNQTVTVNTPQGPMIMHTLPSKPNEHPQALILPDGQIVPVVTQPNLLFPPQQCIPVTGSLLVPSVTPSHISTGLISYPGQGAMATKGQTYAMQSFANVVHMHPPAIDSSQMRPSAQGHLPLPPFQLPSCSSIARPPASRSSKKKPSSSKSSSSAGHPQAMTAMLTPEGSIILTIPSSDVTANGTLGNQIKMVQRPLMPKPLLRSETASRHVATVSQSITANFSSSSSASSSALMPLSISLPSNQTMLPYTAAAVMAPTSVATPMTDILAKATESLFTVSTNEDRVSMSEFYASDVNDDQLQIDINALGDDLTAEGSAVDDGLTEETNKKKPKKKKNSKTKKTMNEEASKPNETMLEMNHEDLPPSFFATPGRHEEEKESDISDFADLIRMEPMTPIPPPHPELPICTKMINEKIQENHSICDSIVEQDEAKTSGQSSKKIKDGQQQSQTSNKDSTTSVGLDFLDMMSNKTTVFDRLIPNGQTTPDDMTTTSSNLTATNVEAIVDQRKMIESNSYGVESSRIDGEKMTHKMQNVNRSDAVAVETEAPTITVARELEKNVSLTKGQKGSSRKKKQKGIDAEVEKEMNGDKVKEKSNEKQDHELVNQHDVPLGKAPKSTTKEKSLLGKGYSKEGDALKVVCEHERVPEPNIAAEPPMLSKVNIGHAKSEKTGCGRKEKKVSGGRFKKTKKADATTECSESARENIRISEKDERSAEEIETRNQDAPGRITRGFALSNFLPVPSKLFYSNPADDTRAGAVGKRTRLADKNLKEADEEAAAAILKMETRLTEEGTQTTKKDLRGKKRDEGDSDNKRAKKKMKKLTEVQPPPPSEPAARLPDMPDTLTFMESDLLDVVDKVENMAAATQTEPKRKSHSRKHKYSGDKDTDGISSKRTKKHSGKDITIDNPEKRNELQTYEREIQTNVDRNEEEKKKDAKKKSNPMDIFSFEMEEASSNNFTSVRTPSSKKIGKNEGLLQEKAASNSPTISASLSPNISKSRFSFFNSDFKGPFPKSTKTSKLDSTAQLRSSAMEPTVSDNADKSVALETGDNVEQDRPENEAAANNKLFMDCFVPLENLSNAVSNVPCQDVSDGHAKNETALVVDQGKPPPPPQDGSGAKSDDGAKVDGAKASCGGGGGKARHSNIVSLARQVAPSKLMSSNETTGGLSQKSTVTKLSSHAQRNKQERESLNNSNLKMTKKDNEGINTSDAAPSSNKNSIQAPSNEKNAVQTLSSEKNTIQTQSLDKNSIQVPPSSDKVLQYQQTDKNLIETNEESLVSNNKGKKEEEKELEKSKTEFKDQEQPHATTTCVKEHHQRRQKEKEPPEKMYRDEEQPERTQKEKELPQKIEGDQEQPQRTLKEKQAHQKTHRDQEHAQRTQKEKEPDEKMQERMERIEKEKEEHLNLQKKQKEPAEKITRDQEQPPRMQKDKEQQKEKEQSLRMQREQEKHQKTQRDHEQPPQRTHHKEKEQQLKSQKEQEPIHKPQEQPQERTTHREKEQIPLNDLFSQNSNNHNISQPLLSQCAYNDSYQKSQTPSSITGHGGNNSHNTTDMTCNQGKISVDENMGSGSSSSARRSACHQKTNDVIQTSMRSKVGGMTGGALSYNSTGSGSDGSGIEMERKSWQDDSRRRMESDYFVAPLSSVVPSCAVQEKNSDLYSCSSVYPTDKGNMVHHQMESSGNFVGLSRNPFYPPSLPSAFGGLDQFSPCGDSIARDGLLSCGINKHSSAGKTGNQSADGNTMTRDMSKQATAGNQHEGYFSSHCGSQFLEPSGSPALSSMNRDKMSCHGTSLSLQTNSRQPVLNASSNVGRSRSQTRSPSMTEQQGTYSALTGYHSSSVPGSISTPMLHHPPSMSDYRYANNGQHSLGFDMFQSPGSQFNPNLTGLSFDPPPLNFLRDCSSAGGLNNAIKKTTSKSSDPQNDSSVAAKASLSNVARAPSSHQTQSNPTASCKTSSNRSSSKSSSSKKSSSSSSKLCYSGVDTSSNMFDAGRCVTPFFGLGSLSPTRTMPPDSLAYFPPNIFGNTGRSKTLQHRDTPIPFNPSLFSPSRVAQNGIGLNFQTGFGMDHMHGTHMSSSQVMPPPSANTMPAHMHGFGFGNIFPEIGGTVQRDPLSNMSPIKFTGGMEAGTLHHHQQGGSSMYNGRGQLPPHMLHDMGFNPFLAGHQHPGFDARSIGTPFGSHGHAASFGMFPMHNL